MRSLEGLTGFGSPFGAKRGQYVEPAPSAPVAGVAMEADGNLITISAYASGFPTNFVFSLESLTLDGVDVSADAVALSGGRTWSYEVPADAGDQTLAAEVSATNTIGTDTATGSIVVRGDQSSTPDTWQIAVGDGGAVVTSFPAFAGTWSITPGDGSATINSFPSSGA